MTEINMNSVQNRFTAYLVAAVTNQRIHYMERKRHLQNLEFVQNDLQEKNYLDFDTQYHDYLGEQTEFIMEERDRKLLFARVFGELSFTELGEKFGMNPKQAEMAYYYIIRKLRKELEVSTRHEF